MQTNDLFNIPSPLQEFPWPEKCRSEFEKRNLRLFVKRDDLIHPFVSGNKWRKLKLNIEQAQHAKKKGILTFGGAYSNHLLATAAACSLFGLKSIGLVRGEELKKDSNSNLEKCTTLGMELLFLSREEYSMKEDWDYLTELKSEYSEYLLVPEGGKNFHGTIGCQEIIKEIDIDFDEIWLAQGTCTTSIGIALALMGNQKAHGVSALKGFDAAAEIKKIIRTQFHDDELATEVLEKMVLHSEYSFGGYAKTTDELDSFIRTIEKEIDLPLDEIYTAKAFYAMIDYYHQNKGFNDAKVVFLHTGGLANKKGLANTRPF